MDIILTKEQQDVYADSFELLCDKARMRSARKPQSLCWHCNKLSGCSWLDNEKPVIGWQAIRNDIEYRSSNLIYKSYFVYGCPQFVKGEERSGIYYPGE